MSDLRQPRSSVVFGFYHQAHHFAGVKQEAVAHGMMTSYRDQTAPDFRYIQCKEETTLSKQMAADQKRLSRYLNPQETQLLPADLEEHLVMQYPEPFRTQCITKLVRRYGSLYVPIPESSGGADFARVSRVAKEFGETMTAVAPILEDLVIDAKDLPYLRSAEEQIDDLIAAATALKHHIQQVREAAESGKTTPTIPATN